MMRVYIMTDLEGVAGVLDSENWCLRDSKYYEPAKELLTREANAAIEGFLEAGATDILVADGHGYGGIISSLLHPAAELARNWASGAARPFSLNAKPFDVAAWVGQHPKSGTLRGHLCHTGSMGVRELTINGVSVGEFGELVFCAGELGVRSIFASGCQAFTEEARALVPGIETVAVKRGTQTDPGHSLPADAYRKHNAMAIHLSPEEARRRIREGAAKGLRRAADEDFGRVVLEPPYEAVIVLRSDAENPPRIGRNRHPRSVIELLNLPWQLEPLTNADPLNAVSD